MRSKRTIAIELGNRCDKYEKIENPSRDDMHQLASDMLVLAMEMRAALAAGQSQQH